MRCTHVTDIGDHLPWINNFLCVPETSPIIFSWSMEGPIPGKDCIKWDGTPDASFWKDNYMCAELFPVPRLVYP